jgi:serine/threonine protein kinase
MPPAHPLYMIAGQILGGHYQVEKFLGKGGFGETYLARDNHLPDRPYRIVKKLKPQSNDPFVLQAAQILFEREAQVLYQLGELSQVPRQIPKLFAHFEDNQEFYLVQEYIEGHDLTDEIPPQRSKLSEAEVTQLLREILEALEFVHQQKIIHRDIKPANIRRRKSDGKIVLIDFGAVKQIATKPTNQQGTVTFTLPIGTPGYMPDEQEKGYPKLSSDIYAVGMLAIQALTGIPPHKLSRDSKTLEITWQNQAAVGAELAVFLNKMVAYNSANRYKNATEALSAITVTFISPIIPTPSQNVKQNSQNLLLIYLSVFLTTIMGIILGWFIYYSLNNTAPNIPEPPQEPPQKPKVW